SRERPETGDRGTADWPAASAEVIDDGGRRVRDGSHRDDDLGRILAAVRLDATIGPSGEDGPVAEGGGQLARQPVVEGPLPQPTLHVAVLVLDDAGHE